MMMKLCSEIISALKGRTLSTAESCTGGGIGVALTAVPGSSAVYKGGVISYTNDIKSGILRVSTELLEHEGAVSAAVAEAMAVGVRRLLGTDIAISVTGLAGPGGDNYGNPVGTVFIGYTDTAVTFSRRFLFSGSREDVRNAAVKAALELISCCLTDTDSKTPDA